MPGLGFQAFYVFDPADLPLFDPDRDPADLAREAAEFESHYADHAPRVSDILLRHLGTLRGVSRVLGDDAMRAAQAGDAKTTIDDLLAIFDIADHADEQKLLINQLVTISIWADALERTSRVIVDHPDLLSDEQLVRLAQRINKTRGYRIDYAGERYQIYDTIQHLYTENGRGNGHLDMVAIDRLIVDRGASLDGRYPEPPAMLSRLMINAISVGISPALVMLTADREETIELVDRIFKLYAEDADVPMWVRPQSKGDAELERVFDDSSYARLRYTPIAIYLNSIGAVRETVSKYVALADGSIAALALQRYRLAHGQYPDTLDALIPTYLNELPLDPLNGEPLRYRHIDGRSLLYGLGTDRDDDGGRWTRGAEGKINFQFKWEASDEAFVPDGDWPVWPRYEGAYDASAPEEDLSD